MTKSSKIIFSIILVFIAIGIFCVSLVGYFIIKDIKMESILEDEFSNINHLMEVDIFNEKIDEYLNEGVTSKDYLKVELAIKAYLKDLVGVSRELKKLIKDENYEELLSVETFKNDGPNFTKTLNFLKDSKIKFKNIEKKLQKLSDYENVINHIKKYNVSEYYLNIFEDIVGNKMNISYSQEIINSDLNDCYKTIDFCEKIFQFLKENSDKWYIENDSIHFNNEETKNYYDRLLEEFSKETVEKDEYI